MSGVLYILRGLPSSGKTTYAQQYLESERQKGNTNVQIVERDKIRAMAGLGVEPTNYEGTVTLQQHALIRAGLKAGHTVISSDMNLKASYVKEMAKIADFFGAEVKVIDFDTSVEVCIERDRRRGEQGGHSVGEAFIRNTYKKFFRNGEFPKSPVTNTPPVEMEPYVPDTTLPKAYIVDIDGTLAKIPPGGRSPYDYTRVAEDLPHKDVIKLVEELRQLDYKIIFVSGREDSCKRDTLNWLNVYTDLTASERDEDWTSPLYMRPAGDGRQDAIIKYEIFNKHIRNQYNVIGVLDDRAQVINMWRNDLDIRTYQVADGNF
jgi:Straboviridae polynucleotide kinase